jgi:hypothetical protein
MHTHGAVETTSPRSETRQRIPLPVAQDIAPPASPQRDVPESVDTRPDGPSAAAVENPVTTRQATLQRESADADPILKAQAALALTADRSTPEHAPSQSEIVDAPLKQDGKPSITITIGRIAIDFGREAPAAAPAAAREVQRTRGFENYVDARRGRSR